MGSRPAPRAGAVNRRVDSSLTVPSRLEGRTHLQSEKMRMMMKRKLHLTTCVVLFLAIMTGLIDPVWPAEDSEGSEPRAPAGDAGLGLIRPSTDGSHFVRADSGARFVAWGFNYDHDDSGRLLEGYWQKQWSTVVEDFNEMNEPILPGERKPETEWLAGEFGGKHFVQRITLDRADKQSLAPAGSKKPQQ